MHTYMKYVERMLVNTSHKNSVDIISLDFEVKRKRENRSSYFKKKIKGKKIEIGLPGIKLRVVDCNNVP